VVAADLPEEVEVVVEAEAGSVPVHTNYFASGLSGSNFQPR
jgi:hypothetical protein